MALGTHDLIGFTRQREFKTVDWLDVNKKNLKRLI